MVADPAMDTLLTTVSPALAQWKESPAGWIVPCGAAGAAPPPSYGTLLVGVEGGVKLKLSPPPELSPCDK